jgi:hypothetical protein
MRIAVFIAAGLAVFAGILHAQSDDDEDEMDYFPLVPTGSSMHFGMRIVGGPKVSFHNVGTVPVSNSIADANVPSFRSYNDGTVGLDGRTDSGGRPSNDGLTNSWSANYASQITSSGDVAYHLHSTNSFGTNINGGTATASGWELQFGKSYGKIARKVDFSLIGGITFAGINSKKSTEVTAQFTTLTDTYSLYGQVPPSMPYTAPTTQSQRLVDSNGAPVLNANGGQATQSTDASILISQNPTRVVSSTNSDGTPAIKQVQGHWQIKGAYYTFRFGPMFQVPVTERIKLTFAFGAAASFVGTSYKEDEEIVIDDVIAPITNVQEKTRSVLLPAVFADANAEYWLTERTGFYLGATYQKSKSFNQTLDDSSATVDLGSTSGFQSGFTLRF